MSVETNKAIARRLYDEVISGGNWATADELLDVNLADPVVHARPRLCQPSARRPYRLKP